MPTTTDDGDSDAKLNDAPLVEIVFPLRVRVTLPGGVAPYLELNAIVTPKFASADCENDDSEGVKARVVATGATVMVEVPVLGAKTESPL